MDSVDHSELHPNTRLVSRGRSGTPGDPMNVPIIPTSNFRPSAPEERAREYAREDGTQSWDAFEDVLGDLEGGRAYAFASGIAAIHAALELVPIGGKVVVPLDYYSGARALLADGAASGRWSVIPADATDPEAVAEVLPGASMLWVETPSNPLLEVSDIAELSRRAQECGALVVADNTFATPLLQNPLGLGADVVVHSATKYIGGHSDLLMGVAIARDPQLAERLHHRRTLAGATPGALECFLALRGLRTLAVRMDRSQANAAELAVRLHDHPAVAKVRYPGNSDHPQADVVRRQMRGAGAMLSFDVADADTADRVCASVRVIESATSLGGVESCIERRAKLPGQPHVPANLLRLSVGIEDVDDLWADLVQAMNSASS